MCSNMVPLNTEMRKVVKLVNLFDFPPTAVWCKSLSELSCAILESFNILCNSWFKIIRLRKSGLHIDIVVESM